MAENKALRRALARLNMIDATTDKPKAYQHEIKPPTVAPGVVPAGKDAPCLAMDSNSYRYLNTNYCGGGFVGYPYLSQLATRAEYRAFASALSTELTREWIEFTSSGDDDNDVGEKIKMIEAEMTRANVRGVMQTAAEHDCYFGRAQVFIDVGGDPETPLILNRHTLPKGCFKRVTAVEAVWTTPSAYNALDPTAPDFYRPSRWFMLGKEVHASRLYTVITRPLPDILKPAFNFGGMSLSQLAEPYVDNWLRTRQSVSDLINTFSITALATSMDGVLQDAESDGKDIFARAELFTRMRSNKGMMLLDKDLEELVQINTPLSGLHELQAQSQEHMCSVSRMPAVILTGISPSGLNASSDGEIKVFYDWIAAQQTAYWYDLIMTIVKVIQLSLFGEIDPDIGFKFVPLYQMTPAEEAEIRNKDSATDCAYIDHSVISPEEVRERLARDHNSKYSGLDLSVSVVPPPEPPQDGPPDDKEDMAKDADFEENKHPRADNGQFGSGSGGGKLRGFKDKFDNPDLTKPERVEMVRSTADAFANKMRNNGFDVTVEHSGSNAGPSSYVTVADIDSGVRTQLPIRFSDHSKGVRESQGVIDISDLSELDGIEKALIDARNEKVNSEEYKNKKTADLKNDEQATEAAKNKWQKVFDSIKIKKQKGESLNSNERYAESNSEKLKAQFKLDADKA